MKRVVSVSLGSSKDDSKSQFELLGEQFEVARIGTNGDMDRFAKLVRELDGNVDAIGLGGIDRYVWTDKHRYTFRDADILASNAKKTPVVDGSGVKNTIERKTVRYLQDNGIIDFSDKKVLVVCAVDRFGMAQSISKVAKSAVYGDLMFNVGVPIPMRSYAAVRILGTIFLPIIVKLPFKWFYPTGSEQEKTEPKYQQYYAWADIIAGDKHIIRRSMPTPDSGLLEGKTIITNTVTSRDTNAFVERKVRMLVTPMPESLRSPEGRYYATNIFEGVIVALLGKKLADITPADYDDILDRINWHPTITELGNRE